MNKKLNINVFFDDNSDDILEVLEQDFREFLNDYIKQYFK